MVDLQINKQIIIIVDNISGGPISTFEWKLDNTLQLNNTNTLTIPQNSLSLGFHTIKFRGQNYCGNWSPELIENINITEAINMVEKTVTVVIDQPIVSTTIVMDYIGTIETTVTDGVNPVAGASIELDAVATGIVTGIDGKASIPNVSYGTHTVKAIKI